MDVAHRAADMVDVHCLEVDMADVCRLVEGKVDWGKNLIAQNLGRFALRAVGMVGAIDLILADY